MFGRYRGWRREGLFDRILQCLHLEFGADERIDWDVFDVDGTNLHAPLGGITWPEPQFQSLQHDVIHERA